MPSRLPAIPTLPADVDWRVRHAFHAMREVVLSLLGSGDPRDARPSSEELSSLYGRLYDLERAAQLSVYNASRAGSVLATEDGDGMSAIGFVLTSGAGTGAMHPTDGADTAAFSGGGASGSTMATTDGADTGALSGTVT